jgi:hypothetical protein
MVHHSVAGLTRERVLKYQADAAQDDRVQWVRHFVSLSHETIVSEFEAPDAGSLVEWLHAIELPFNYIVEAEYVGAGRDLQDKLVEPDFLI